MMQSLGKKNYSEEGNLSLNLGSVGEKERKQIKEISLCGKRACLISCCRKKRKGVNHICPWELWRSCRETLWRAAPGQHPLLFQAILYVNQHCKLGAGGEHAQITQCHASRCLSTSWDHEGQSTGRKGLCDLPRDFLFLCAF